MIRIPHPSRELLEALETAGVLPVTVLPVAVLPVAVPPVAVPPVAVLPVAVPPVAVPPVAVPPVAVPRKKGQCNPQHEWVLTRLIIAVAFGAALFVGWCIGRMGQAQPAKQTPRSLVILRGY